MSIMYGTLLRKYETVKDDFGLLSKRYFILFGVFVKICPKIVKLLQI